MDRDFAVGMLEECALCGEYHRAMCRKGFCKVRGNGFACKQCFLREARNTGKIQPGDDLVFRL